MKPMISCQFEFAIDTLHPLPSIPWTPLSKSNHTTEKPYEGDSPAFFKSPIGGGCSVANSRMARAINRFIVTTPHLCCRSMIPPPASSTVTLPDDREALEDYIIHVLGVCEMPNIVSYTALYLLMTISRSCKCTATPDPPAFEDDSGGSSKQGFSVFFHYLSGAFTRSPLSRVRKPHWDGQHYFLGPFILALRSYERISGSTDVLSYEMLSVITGLSIDDLRELESSIYDAMEDDTKLAINEMIETGEFRDLVKIECPRILARRRRDFMGDPDSRTPEKGRIGRLFSAMWKRGSQSEQ